MKKIYFLSLLCVGAFASCTKENKVLQPLKPTSEIEQPGKIRVMTDGSGGSSTTIVYDAASGQYKANFGGAELVFSSIPNNTNYADNDIALTGITCTNCSDFTTNGYTFTAVIPVLPASYLADIHSQLSTYNQAFSDFVDKKYVIENDPTSGYKQPTLPNYPAVSSTYSGTISGVIVRSHSSPTTCIIKPATFLPNIPSAANIIGIEIGGISQIDPITGHNIYYEIFIDNNTGRITLVTANDQVTHQALSNVTYTGTCTTTGTGVNKVYKVTMKVYVDGVSKIDVTNHQIVE
ncbi:MAG: hypothetical protein WC615_11535 [Mucilaginibacter sp.]|jgi:hypothetical protein|uniref:hypothetical protein n=1 Tax=Mucilaginibacter sp. TaxID=1882438 RepID=UPI00356AC8AE